MTPIKAMIEEAARAIWNAGEPYPTRMMDEHVEAWDAKAKAALSVFIRRVLREPTPEMIEVVRQEMPVEVDHYQRGGMLHAEIRPRDKCVPPQNLLSALADYIEKEMK